MKSYGLGFFIHPVLFLLLFWSSSSLAIESACTPIDIRDTQPPAVQKYLRTPKLQGGLGSCFAHAAADLLSVYMKTPLSALHLTLMSLEENRQSGTLPDDEKPDGLLDGGPGGDAGETIQIAAGQSICSFSALPDLTIGDPAENNLIIESFTDLHANLLQIKKDPTFLLKIKEKQCPLTYLNLFPELDEILAFQILNENQQKSLLANLIELTQQNCKERGVPIPKKIHLKYLGSTKKAGFISEINQQLQRMNPLAISLKFKKEVHQVSLIGRKMIHGKCNYLVRNSYGTTCEYNPERYQKNCNAADGTFWIPENLLSHDLIDVTSINLDPIPHKSGKSQ